MSTVKFAYASNSNFFLASEALTEQPFAVVGVPFDGAVTNRPGARFGPQEIRRASLMLCDGIYPHFDARCDTWSDHFGEPSGHGTWTYEAIQEGLVSPRHTVQIGLRSSGARAARQYVADQGGLIFTAREVRGLDGPALNPLITQVRERLGTTANLVWTYLSGQVAKRLAAG